MNYVTSFFLLCVAVYSSALYASDTKEAENGDEIRKFTPTVQIVEMSDKDRRYIRYGEEAGRNKCGISAYESSYFMAFDSKGEFGRFAECLNIYDAKRDALLCIFSREYPWGRPLNIKIGKNRVVTYDYQVGEKTIGQCSFDVDNLKFKFVPKAEKKVSPK